MCEKTRYDRSDAKQSANEAPNGASERAEARKCPNRNRTRKKRRFAFSFGFFYDSSRHAKRHLAPVPRVIRYRYGMSFLSQYELAHPRGSCAVTEQHVNEKKKEERSTGSKNSPSVSEHERKRKAEERMELQSLFPVSPFISGQ